ncbi:hypothetical protein Taro_035285 [Colocasia esculenta]|uniref:Aminotransferase-like plant mobile domain-containing protein n=1 Tax=Colocasia esculenta TaxID=4460 RepID=A0A843W673_COLES|nr:hypothetical protein [Colocasia esculenta]
MPSDPAFARRTPRPAISRSSAPSQRSCIWISWPPQPRHTLAASSSAAHLGLRSGASASRTSCITSPAPNAQTPAVQRHHPLASHSRLAQAPSQRSCIRISWPHLHTGAQQSAQPKPPSAMPPALPSSCSAHHPVASHRCSSSFCWGRVKVLTGLDGVGYGKKAARRRGRQGRDLPVHPDTGIMRPRTMWPLVAAAYQGLLDFQKERVREMGFGSILEIKPFFIDLPLIQAVRERWDRASRAFLFPWGHMVPSLEDVARITRLRVDGEAVTGVTYADYTDLAQDFLGLEPHGDDLGDRRVVGRVTLLGSLGLAKVRQRADELLPDFVERAVGLARAAYGQDRTETERVDRDLRRFLVFFFGKMLFTTKGDVIHCRFLEILGDLGRVGRYAWGAALLTHTFADLSTGTGRETTVGGFAPFLQVWSYHYLPLGRATVVRPDAVPLARRWLPLVVWEPYANQGDADQPWVVSGRPLFRRDIWVHCLNEIETLRLRLAARTLGLHQGWCEKTEPRGIGKKTRGKAMMVDWRTRFPKQYADWQRRGQLVESDAPDSIAYLWRFQEDYLIIYTRVQDGRNTLIDQLQGQLASTEVQMIKARAALETLRAAQLTGERADTAGASSSRGAPAPEVASHQQQLSAAVERAGRAEHDLLARSKELRDALARETDTAAELTQLRSQLTRREHEIPREVAELQALLSLERCDLERQQARWEQERSRWELERRDLVKQCVEARTSQGVMERLLKESEERYRRGRERAREQGRASAYSGSILATSSQYERNVRDATTAQRSTGSQAPMGPPALPTVTEQGEAESSRQARPAEGGDESQLASP